MSVNQTTILIILAQNSTSTNDVNVTTHNFLDLSIVNIYYKLETMIYYILAIFAAIGFLLTLVNFVLLSINFKWKNSAKFYYLVTAISSMGVSINYDILLVLPNGVYSAFNITLYIDEVSLIFCKGHHYLTPIFEIIWMWNVATFAIKRSLIVSFPLKFVLISRILSKKINKNELAQTRINLVVITTSTSYIIIILPWCLLAFLCEFRVYLPSPLDFLATVLYFDIYNMPIVFLRTLDVAVLLIIVKDYWKLFVCKYI